MCGVLYPQLEVGYSGHDAGSTVLKFVLVSAPKCSIHDHDVLQDSVLCGVIVIKVPLDPHHAFTIDVAWQMCFGTNNCSLFFLYYRQRLQAKFVFRLNDEVMILLKILYTAGGPNKPVVAFVASGVIHYPANVGADLTMVTKSVYVYVAVISCCIKIVQQSKVVAQLMGQNVGRNHQIIIIFND